MRTGAGGSWRWLSPGRRVWTPLAGILDAAAAAPCSMVTDSAASAAKRSWIQEALTQQGLEGATVGDIIASPLRSRRRAVLSWARATDRIGFFRPRTHDVEALEECLVLAPEIFEARACFAEACRLLPDSVRLAQVWATQTETGLDIELRSRQEIDLTLDVRMALAACAQQAGWARLTVAGELIAMNQPPRLSFDGVAVAPPPGAFLQATKEGEQALIDLVRVGVGEARRVVDLFSGCGTFSLPLAQQAELLAADGEDSLCKALEVAARMAQGLKRVQVERRDLMRNPLRAEELKGIDAVVFDPPRAGALAQAREIGKSNVARVVAVSCNPATFARDARALVEAEFQLLSVTPVDQFLFSPHLELVSVFARD